MGTAGVPAERVLAALSYAAISMMLGFSNKFVLGEYGFRFPVLLTAAQFVWTVGALGLLAARGVFSFPVFSWERLYQARALAVTFGANAVFVAGATSTLSVPMLATLRRLGLVIVILLDTRVRGVTPSRAVLCTIGVQLFGALISAANDLAFDAWAYAAVMLANLATAAHVVFAKHVMTLHNFSNAEMLYYGNLGALPVLLLLTGTATDFAQLTSFPSWGLTGFLTSLSISVLSGALLNLTIFWNTSANSPLTQTVTGQAKNAVSFFVSFLLFSDYVYDPYNFAGMLASMAGSVLYAIVKFREARQLPSAASTPPVPATPSTATITAVPERHQRRRHHEEEDDIEMQRSEPSAGVVRRKSPHSTADSLGPPASDGDAAT